MKSIIASVALAITASSALAEPVTCEQFFATLGEGLKETYNAPPLTYGKTLAYGEFKDIQVTAFPGVYIGISCLRGTSTHSSPCRKAVMNWRACILA
jgi:hypothetical protein